ncbi:hypothetical protein AK830_g7903 [Neonectria ditissima]|uniref:N-acetyltransferase domain-containing protein n=1 Tax=Neonectria ditissima TaxID=78410 RepID=A0A0P7BE25_9HYPO|nr:hypothetical protein AK830_g7903 [Neonectria ditissima]
MTTSQLQRYSPGVEASVSIRKAQLTDAPSIAKLGANVFTATFGHSVPPHELQAFLNAEYTTSAILKDIEDENKDVVVAMGLEGDILGFAYLTTGSSEPCVEHVESRVELQRIYVHPSGQGKGVGRLLSSTIDEMAKEKGFENIWLGVWEENTRALKAYEKWGYQQVGHHDFAIGEIVQRDHVLLKSL